MKPSEGSVVIIGISVVTLFLLAFYLWKPPVSAAGKLSLKLLSVNAGCWYALLLSLLDGPGHPPLVVVVFVPCVLLNVVLIPAASVAIWQGYDDADENSDFLGLATLYVILNILTLLLPMTLALL